MQGRSDQLKAGYEAFQVGDFDRAMEDFADNIRWEMPAAQGLPAPGVFYGKDEVRWMFEQLRRTYGEGLNARPLEYIEAGQTVVTLGHLEAEPNGNRFRVPYSTVWRFNEAGEAQHALTLFDTAVVREALAGEPRPGETSAL